MAGRKKLPVDLIDAREGGKHLTRDERESRREMEIHIRASMHRCDPPDFILGSDRHVARFHELASMLSSVMPDNFGAPDADCLGRYVMAQCEYEDFTERLEAELRSGEPDLKDLRRLKLLQSAAFNEAHKTASELGLTVTSRCKVVVPGGGGTDVDDDF